MTKVPVHDQDAGRETDALGPAAGPAAQVPVARPVARRWLWLLLRLLVTGLLLGVFFSRFPPLDLFEQAGGRLLALVAVGTSLIALTMALNTVRWLLLARSIGAPLAVSQGVGLTLVGQFFNQFLPTSVGGDVVRAWGARQAGLRLRDAVSSVVLDRLAGIIALLVLLIVGMPFLAARLDSRLPLAIAAILAIGFAVGIVVLVKLNRLPLSWRRLPGFNYLAELAKHVIDLLNRPRIAVAAFVLSLFGHAIVLYLTAMLAGAFGVALSLLEALTIVPGILLLSSLPLSISGWGLREGGFAGGFFLLGLPTDAAVATSILIGLIGAVVALPGGVLFALGWGHGALNAPTATTPMK